jgi:Flp pilus assembly secretin CpaC
MSVWFLRAPARAFLAFASLSALVLLYPGSALAAPDDDAIAVNVDQAKLVRLPKRVTTIVVGNPLIADVTLQPGGVMVVTGKGYGATNVIAMDNAGDVLVDHAIQVEGATGQIVTVYRGVVRESYSCTPACERRPTLGDDDAYFASTMGQIGSRNNQATGGGGAAAKP